MARSFDPDCALSRCELSVRFCETDLMGVVHHANYPVYCESGRVDWLKKRGVRYQAWAELGIHLPVVEASLRFRKAARFGDVVCIETRAVGLTRVTVSFDYRLTRQGELLCEARTRLACVSDDLRPRRIPPEVEQVLCSGELPG